MLEIPSSVRYHELDGELFLINVDTGYYFSLNEVGGRMWRALTRHGSLAAALAELGDEFEVEPDRLRADLTDLAGRLRAHGLLQDAGEPG